MENHLQAPDPGTNPFDNLRRVGDDGTEHWSARDLMPYLGYVEWRNFEQAIERAKVAITVQEFPVTSHVVGVNVMVNLPQGGSRMMGDYQLSRYGAYHVALSGDPRKPEVASAIRYFVVKTRAAETAPAPTPAIPQTYAEALRAAADLSERAELAEARVAKLEPAAAAWTELEDADGDYAVGDAAKILARAGIDIGRDRLFTFMESIAWIYRDSQKRWCAYQASVDAGRLVEKVSGTHPDPYTGREVLNHPTIRITAKGLKALLQKMSRGSDLALVGPRSSDRTTK
jgi:DNA-damage-inducible protein D